MAHLGIAARMSGAALALAAASLAAQERGPVRDATAYVAGLEAPLRGGNSELRGTIERFTADESSLTQRYPADWSRARRDAARGFYRAWQERVRGVEFGKLSQEGKVDYLLLRQELTHRLDLLDLEERRLGEITPLLPFGAAIRALDEARERVDSVAPEASARALGDIARQADSARKSVEPADSAARPGRIVALRASQAVESHRKLLAAWRKHYAGYDPLFTWWTTAPYAKADSALLAYGRTLREKILGVKQGDDDPIVGDPLGREALVRDIAFEMIPYSPEELIAIGERELAWCENEMKKAARAMGLGDDWHAALERVKQQHVEPGAQPLLVKRLADEAADWVSQRNLVTVPPLARDDWRLIMLTPEEQKVNPFFLGGDNIYVAFPTDAMADDDKRMTLRGNNIHFSRATVHHELIPGHHLQAFYQARSNPHRNAFSTPFWTEGWAVYWEMVLYDGGFPRAPEDRVGMLFWRMHRAARIIFSLKFHLGEMTPDEAIDFLVDRVGHERANATAEVRRSFNGSYPPLYQAGYMLGALQLRALRAEVVGRGRMTDRDFHDAILAGNQMPIELVRARLLGLPLSPDHVAKWRFDSGK
jgi:uncharacterized protein (DUF885 family)